MRSRSARAAYPGGGRRLGGAGAGHPRAVVARRQLDRRPRRLGRGQRRTDSRCAFGPASPGTPAPVRRRAHRPRRRPRRRRRADPAGHRAAHPAHPGRRADRLTRAGPDRRRTRGPRPVTLAGWRVPVLVYAPDDALSLLRALDDIPAVPGATLRHLAELADFAADLVTRGRVLPGVRTTTGDQPPAAARATAAVDGVGCRPRWRRRRASATRCPRRCRAQAVWRPLLTGTDAAWARALALALPPGRPCRHRGRQAAGPS